MAVETADLLAADLTGWPPLTAFLAGTTGFSAVAVAGSAMTAVVTGMVAETAVAAAVLVGGRSSGTSRSSRRRR
ncbi:hypothetical protein GCM10009533_68010 [Saccharopolyspora spinosporotrichia]|uniref:Uncharacterized protein n=1 Tax=Saccharopolyspora erythraea TaxID=1836 RepID=A0ABP3PDG4_SACER